jgi:hypothetical protein
MMTSVNFDQNLHENNSSQTLDVQYRGWSIYTNLIRGKLWVHWQHPKDPTLRYGCPLTDAGMEGTINHVRFLIDTAILLETRGMLE